MTVKSDRLIFHTVDSQKYSSFFSWPTSLMDLPKWASPLVRGSIGFLIYTYFHSRLTAMILPVISNLEAWTCPGFNSKIGELND